MGRASYELYELYELMNFMLSGPRLPAEALCMCTASFATQGRIQKKCLGGGAAAGVTMYE